MGECRNDYGGYFIINGKEKALVSQEEFGNNMLRVYRDTTKTSPYTFLADIRTKRQDSSMLPRSLSVRLVAPDANYTNKNIVVSVPNLHRPIPLFILFRALGVISDREIIEYCLLDLDKYSSLIDLFRPSIQDTTKLCSEHSKRKNVPQSKCSTCESNRNRNNSDLPRNYDYVLTQCDAIEYMRKFVKGKATIKVWECLNEFFLPNVGVSNYIEKAKFLGYMVKNLLMVSTGRQNETDRDSYRFKRVLTSGTLLYGLFTEYFKKYAQNVHSKFDEKINKSDINSTLSKTKTKGDGGLREKVDKLIGNIYRDNKKNKNEIFYGKINVMDSGIRKAFKGRWGAERYTIAKRVGVVQDLKRLSYNSFISHLRKVVTPMDDSTKIVKPHLIHSSSYGLFDPVDTPDGSKVGLHKYLSLGTHITQAFNKTSNDTFVNKVLGEMKRDKENPLFRHLDRVQPRDAANKTKVFMNGSWIGITSYPDIMIGKLRRMRKDGVFSIYVSISWNIQQELIEIFTDEGRLSRPLFTLDKNKSPYYSVEKGILERNEFSWNQLLYKSFKSNNFPNVPSQNGEDLENKVKVILNSEAYSSSNTLGGSIEYLDTAEENTRLIANYEENLTDENNTLKRYTHVEIHPSLIFGYMGNHIVFPENNQSPRNVFSCGQSQQAISLYNSNYFSRMDKMAVVLNYGQIPLIKSRYTSLLFALVHGVIGRSEQSPLNCSFIK